MTTRAEKTPKGWALSGDEAVRSLGPRRQRAADSRARARRTHPVPRRARGRGPHHVAGPGHGPGDALGAGRPRQGAGRRPTACSARPARPRRCSRACSVAAPSARRPRCSGAARRCLDMAVGYAKVREQFGQPIGSFQAIRHKCAEMLLEVENSHSAVYYAAWALDAKAEDDALAASVAKAYVGDASRKVCGEAIQVHGGIGFTWEYDLHIYFKRAKALEVDVRRRRLPSRADRPVRREVAGQPRAPVPAAARRNPRRRSDQLHRRLVRGDAARRSRGGGHQGRGARRRFVSRAAGLLRLEPRQALDRGQPQESRGRAGSSTGSPRAPTSSWRTCARASPSGSASATSGSARSTLAWSIPRSRRSARPARTPTVPASIRSSRRSAA